MLNFSNRLLFDILGFMYFVEVSNKKTTMFVCEKTRHCIARDLRI